MPAQYEAIIITEEFLNNHPEAFFVYGDNLTNAAGNTLSTVHIQGNCLD